MTSARNAMAATSTRRLTAAPGGVRPGIALAVADANWFTTENLFRELDGDDVSTLLLKCHDYFNGWRKGLAPWSGGRPLTRPGRRLWQRELVLPSGWMKRFPSWGM